MLETETNTLQAPSLLACGAKHAAAVVNGELYTWGKSQGGRLGTGSLMMVQNAGPVSRVEHLHMLQIKVRSVACGAGFQ